MVVSQSSRGRGILIPFWEAAAIGKRPSMPDPVLARSEARPESGEVRDAPGIRSDRLGALLSASGSSRVRSRSARILFDEYQQATETGNRNFKLHFPHCRYGVFSQLGLGEATWPFPGNDAVDLRGLSVPGYENIWFGRRIFVARPWTPTW